MGNINAYCNSGANTLAGDGSGAGAQVLVATIGAGTALAAEDFLVI